MLFGLLVIAAIDLIIVNMRKKRQTWFYWLLFTVGIIGTERLDRFFCGMIQVQ
ncbi:hypothetical protein QS257_15255 [Terrilactibacillus sp. S3-3]|nr:hypothetical protein QS257_15255 [Terrilactibacillus sp. S3-3]